MKDNASKKTSLVDVRDMIAITGLVIQGYGLWLISQPAMFVIIGSELLIISVISIWKATK